MKRLLIIIAVSFFAIQLSFAQEQQFAKLGDFKLQSGEFLRDCRIGYRIAGQMNADKSNILVIPTWAGGKTEQWVPNVGPGKMADTAKYYVVLIDALSNGVSSSPSNSTAQPRMNFPRITMRDMVDTEHELLTRVLHINHVKAFMGISMGGMQSFQWMVQYPDFMDEAIPIVGSPRQAPYDLVQWQAQIDAINDNKDWNDGNYTKNPARAAEYEFGAILLKTPEEFNMTHTREQVMKELASRNSGDGSDANDKIRQVEAMMSLNVAEPYGDSLEKAAAAVKAKVLVIVGKEDHTVTPGPAIEFAHLLHADLKVIDDGCGHQYCDYAGVGKAVADFLSK
ncbi:MAG TPA: alpha/beta fold hydrolase [Terriglobales bacterium]|nr:alpha/beta fold hydrolase [Terriglobales bacterium]